MPKGIDSRVAAFLQAKLTDWLAADKDRTHQQVADAVGVSRALISTIVNTGKGIGWNTATGLGRVFGYNSLGELEAAAIEWAGGQNSTKRPATGPPRMRAEARRLRDRLEWADAVLIAQQHRPNLRPEAFERVGRLLDSELDYPPIIDSILIADLAQALESGTARNAAKKLA